MRMMNRAAGLKPAGLLVAVGGLLGLAAAVGAEERVGGYSYFRALEGSATIFVGETQERSDAELHAPLLVGDRVWTSPRSRADILLSDGNQLSLDGDTEVTFERVAYSPDAQDRETLIVLHRGRLVIDRAPSASNLEVPVIDTDSARVYLQDPGRTVVEADGAFTRVIVRAGFAEVVDQNGSSIVRANESLQIEGRDQPRTSLDQAPRISSFESWAMRTDQKLTRN